jgi:hypothetical protein
MRGCLRAAWRGDLPLWVAFWLVYAVGFFFSTILSGLLVFAARNAGILGAGWAVGGGLWLAYQMFSAVSVWNSARRQAKSQIWLQRIGLYTAMIVVFLLSGRLLFGLINGGAVRFANLVTGSLDLNP